MADPPGELPDDGYGWMDRGLAIGGVLVIAVGVVVIVWYGWDRDELQASVGRDLHAITATESRILIGGHDDALITGAEGWLPVQGLEDADTMAWHATDSEILAAGHAGLFRSVDGGATFSPMRAGLHMHALGGNDEVLYAASPAAGLMHSRDGGRTFATVGATAITLTGAIFVDPTAPQRLLAVDPTRGVVESTDAGRSWRTLVNQPDMDGLAWQTADPSLMVASGDQWLLLSDDAGRTWDKTSVGRPISAATIDPDGDILIAYLDDGVPIVARSPDGGGSTWLTM